MGAHQTLRKPSDQFLGVQADASLARALGGFARMESEQPNPSWKAQHRYGKIQTPFHHFTALAEGTVGELADGFECPSGSAWMVMKTWASSADESADMIRVIGRQIGFTVTGKIHIYTICQMSLRISK